MSFFDLLSGELAALATVLFIDVVLAGDNAIVVGMAAANVDPSIRRKVILWGIGGAVLLRILFALVTTQLLAIVGLTLAGGILLLWVSWKMYREIRHRPGEEEEAIITAREALDPDPTNDPPAVSPKKSFRQAMIQIIIADISMSLDNVLAVAGAAKDHLWVLVVGLLLSVALMGAAATVIASMLARYRFIAWVGLLVILYVALDMIYRGGTEVFCLDAFDQAACRARGIGAWFAL